MIVLTFNLSVINITNIAPIPHAIVVLVKNDMLMINITINMMVVPFNSASNYKSKTHECL